MSETEKFANVVLPGASFFEKSGTFTHGGRRGDSSFGVAAAALSHVAKALTERGKHLNVRCVLVEENQDRRSCQPFRKSSARQEAVRFDLCSSTRRVGQTSTTAKSGRNPHRTMTTALF